jgi:mannose-6-phosphate isomerase-like protein (cupin superfamily)
VPIAQRYVIGLNENGKSGVVMSGLSNVQEEENVYWRATLWKTSEMPVDNTIPGDRSLDGGTRRTPPPNGMILRALEFWPDDDEETTRRRMVEVNRMVEHDTEITEAERQRHPSMHHTDTLDVGVVLRGEIYCLLDEQELLLRPFDTFIVQGVSHGWRNRGTEPCLMVGVLLDARPRDPDGDSVHMFV